MYDVTKSSWVHPIQRRESLFLSVLCDVNEVVPMAMCLRQEIQPSPAGKSSMPTELEATVAGIIKGLLSPSAESMPIGYKDASLCAFCDQWVDSGDINKWAIPEQMRFVEDIPKTSVGKINKKLIRDQLKD